MLRIYACVLAAVLVAIAVAAARYAYRTGDSARGCCM